MNKSPTQSAKGRVGSCYFPSLPQTSIQTLNPGRYMCHEYGASYPIPLEFGSAPLLAVTEFRFILVAPPRNTFNVPSGGPCGSMTFRPALSRYSSAKYQSKHHSDTFPIISVHPYGLSPSGECNPTGSVAADADSKVNRPSSNEFPQEKYDFSFLVSSQDAAFSHSASVGNINILLVFSLNHLQ